MEIVISLIQKEKNLSLRVDGHLMVGLIKIVGLL